MRRHNAERSCTPDVIKQQGKAIAARSFKAEASIWSWLHWKRAKSIKEAIEYAFQKIGRETLAEWAQKNQEDFFKSVLTRLIPKDITASVSETVEIVIAPHEAAY